jgi:hypothetical protein
MAAAQGIAAADCSALFDGTVKVNFAPLPWPLSAQIFPPWASTIILQMTNRQQKKA